MNFLLRTLTLVLFMLLPCAASAAQLCHTYWPRQSTPINRFINNGDGTLTDSVTSLTWKRCSEGLSGNNCELGTAATFTWQEALQAGTAANFTGKSDWRLPNIKELGSIVERQCTMPAINEILFPNTPTMSFWSSTPHVDNQKFAWNVYFAYGITDGNDKGYKFYVRLVRGGK